MRSFLRELRRRRVIRVTVAYCALAWLLLDVSDTFLSALGLPEWSTKLVVALLLLGLPLSVFLAWAFDLTPSGVQRTPAQAGRAGLPAIGPLAPGLLASAPGAVGAGSPAAGPVGLGAGIGGPVASLPCVEVPPAESTPPAAVGDHGAAVGPGARPAPDGRMTVVALPFVDRSPDAGHQYLGDGITEELINGLASVDGLQVVSRTSAFAFRGQGLDVREIGERLGARCVVEGSVRVAGDQLRLTVQLVDVEHGYAVWSGRYDRRLEDVFDVEEEVARSLVTELDTLLRTTDESAPITAPDAGSPVLLRGTHDIVAYEKYLQGRAAWDRRTPGSLLAAISAFDAALDHDPDYAQASAGLADAYALLMEYGHLDPLEGLEHARAAVDRALGSGPALAETQSALGALRQVEWRWDEADVAFRRASELNPGYSVARQRRALLLAWLGRVEEGEAELQRALRLDPVSPVIAATAGWIRYYAGDPAGALRALEPLLSRDPAFTPAALAHAVSLVATGEAEAGADALERLRRSADSPPHLALHAWALGRAGRTDAAEDGLEAVDRIAGTRYVSAYHRALPRLGLGRTAEALGWLDRARVDGAPQLVYLGADPMFDPLRGEPRFHRLLSTLGLERTPLRDRLSAGVASA